MKGEEKDGEIIWALTRKYYSAATVSNVCTKHTKRTH